MALQGGRGAGRGGRGGPRRRQMRKRAMLGPPPELLLLSHKSTIPQLRKAAAAAVSDTYRMFERFEVGLILHCARYKNAECTSATSCFVKPHQ